MVALFASAYAFSVLTFRNIPVGLSFRDFIDHYWFDRKFYKKMSFRVQMRRMWWLTGKMGYFVIFLGFYLVVGNTMGYAFPAYGYSILHRMLNNPVTAMLVFFPTWHFLEYYRCRRLCSRVPGMLTVAI